MRAPLFVQGEVGCAHDGGYPGGAVAAGAVVNGGGKGGVQRQAVGHPAHVFAQAAAGVDGGGGDDGARVGAPPEDGVAGVVPREDALAVRGEGHFGVNVVALRDKAVFVGTVGRREAVAGFKHRAVSRPRS